MAGKYTAYHVYQDLSFTEANRAATQPYTLPEYHCAHSQRGYLFQFDSMAQRNHFDAATTTCCDEPVLNFQNKPQFAARSNPMRPRDCKPKAQVTGCQALEVSIEDSGAMCASQSARIRRIRIKCPSVCAEFAQIRNGGVLKSRFGTFRSLGMEAEEILILDYTPDPKIVDNVFKTCSGVTTFTEEFCDGHSLTFEVRGGLDFPGDCGCDCCGDLGAFPPPNMNLFTPDVMDGGPQNELTPNITITGDPACQGGEINGIFHGIFGSTELSWPGGVIYNSNGSDRRISRDQPSVGDAANPACCGGEIEWVATDGCGVIKRQTTMINAHVHDISVTPADGAILYENDGYSFVGFGACSYSNAADLNLETACLENGQTALYRIDSALVRNIDSTLRFENSHACSGCCGNGAVNLSFANGCGSFMTASYPVRRPLSQSAYQDTIGKVFKPERFFRDLAPIGYFYRIAVADLRCDGAYGDFYYPLLGYYQTLEECVAQIAGPRAWAIVGPAGAMAIANGDICLFYSDNGGSGQDFMSRIVSVSGEKCCVIETTNGAWINGGPDKGCCPN